MWKSWKKLVCQRSLAGGVIDGRGTSIPRMDVNGPKQHRTKSATSKRTQHKESDGRHAHEKYERGFTPKIRLSKDTTYVTLRIPNPRQESYAIFMWMRRHTIPIALYHIVFVHIAIVSIDFHLLLLQCVETRLSTPIISRQMLRLNHWKMPTAVVAANIKNSAPPMYPIIFSETYLEMYAPPSTAIPVAIPWAAMAPAQTETGFCAADNAMVARKERSPNSAANTRAKILAICALIQSNERGVIVERQALNEECIPIKRR